MGIGVIEIDDCNIRISLGNNVYESGHGLAYIDENELIFGQRALQKLKLKPLHIVDNFWQDLSVNNITATGARNLDNKNSKACSYADLAFQQLRELTDNLDLDSHFILSVPDHYSSEQLSLLLGVVEACQINTKGLIGSALAALPYQSDNNTCAYFDIGLNRSQLSQFTTGDSTELVKSHSIDDMGLLKIINSLAQKIASLFINTTRFNPLHSAESEQALYDQLTVSLSSYHDVFDFSVDGKKSSISKDDITELCASIIQPIIEQIKRHCTSTDTLYLSEQCQYIPGFIAALAQENIASNIVAVEKDQRVKNCLEQQHLIVSNGDGLTLTRSLLRQPHSESKAVSKAQAKVTQLLYNNLCYSLESKTLLSYCNKTKCARFSSNSMDSLPLCYFNQSPLGLCIEPSSETLINDQVIYQTTKLQLGDKISFATNSEILLAIGQA